MSDQQDDYMSAGEVAEYLGLSERQVNRYGAGERPKLRTERRGRRVFYHRMDVIDLGIQLGINKPRPTRPPKAEVMPIGEMLAYLRERDVALERREHELLQLAAELGAVRQQLTGQRVLIDQANENARRLQEALEVTQAERDTLRERLAEVEKPAEAPKRRGWWPW